MTGRMVDVVPDLNDLELAILVSMVAEEHCIFSTDLQDRNDFQNELRLTCLETFGTQPAVIRCTPKTTVDEFNEAILVEADDDAFEDAVERQQHHNRTLLGVDFSHFKGSRSPERNGSHTPGLDDRRIADVIIATDLDLAAHAVQVQVIELICTRRIFTRTAMHTAPKDFLVAAITSESGRRLSHHLNDLFAISHFHATDDGLPHLEDRSGESASAQLAMTDIKGLRIQAEQCRLTAEVAQYLHNVVVFMRMSRYVRGGVTAIATRHFRSIAKALAPLHGLEYVTPSLVSLTARKIYPHRLILATPETEKSLQWGSDPEALRQLYEGLTVEDVIEDVIADVETPL